jgi:hypothetical protein
MLEGWPAANNPAIDRARKLMREFALKRYDESIIEDKEKIFADKLYCTTCRRKKVLRKYPKETMLHIVSHTRRKGKPVDIYTHYCRKCAEDYRSRKTK